MENLSPTPLSVLARQLRVSSRWLRDEAQAGRLPHVLAGRQLLFDAPTVRRLLAERAAASGKGAADAR